MKTMIPVLSALLIGLSALSAPANAQQTICGERGDVASKLMERYKEAPTSMGLANSGSMVEIFSSDDGTFTIVMTHPNGMSCLVAAGEGWEKVKRKVADVGA